MYQSYQEIFGQYQSLTETFKYILERKNTIKEFFAHNQPEEVVFVACGSSYWLSKSAAMTFENKTGIKSYAVTSGNVIMNKDYFQKAYKGPLVIAPSRSGNTTETLYAVEFIKETCNAKVLSISENEDALIRNSSELFLCIPWANEISICQTRSFSNLYLSVILIAALVGNDQALIRDLEKYLVKLESLGPDVENKIKKIVDTFSNWENLVVLGNGELYGVAIEGAYICIEMAQQKANYYQTLELRHGPIIMLDDSYLTVIFSNGKEKKLEEDVIRDCQNKGAKCLVISPLDNFETADYSFNLGWDAFPEVLALYGSFVMQGLAYYKAVNKGINPDMPAGLVSWIKI